ncbi:hypothetical protein SAMN05421679_11121 [Epilithonimonas pallida]|uniref:Uncharacterized protein n=1 Tax=Epilithonimonas pallida TaxID=373671 RepID=A0ABY1R769_9FLAO|nr:hypothetical protein SAMN05421679_11121 [Epilithonimonas pallida]
MLNIACFAAIFIHKTLNETYKNMNQKVMIILSST